MSGLGADGERAWSDLKQHLEWVDGPWLGFVFTQSTAAVRELEQRVRELESPRPGRVLRPRTPHQLRQLLPLLLQPSETEGVTWVEAVHLDPGGGEPGPWVEAWDWFLLRANERRESLLRTVRHGLVLAAPESLKHRFREAAPDLWSVRALVLAPDIPPPQGPPTLLDSPTLEIDALLAQGWVSEAAPLAEDALQRAQERVEERPRDRRAKVRLADAWERVAKISRDQGDLRRAHDAIAACLTIREELAEGPPARRRNQRMELACSQVLASQIALDRKEVPAALTHARAAAAVHRALAKDSDDPETLSDLALALSVLGDAELASGDEDRALQVFTDALVLRQHVLGATNAARHRRWLSVAWGRVGTLRLRLGDRVGARSAWERAWELMQDLAGRDEGNVTWLMEASVAGCRWGDAAFADSELELAEQAWSEALRIREQLAAQDPDNARWQQYLAVAVGRMARLHHARGDKKSAVDAASRALRISEQLVEDHPGEALWESGLERARRRLSEVSGNPL